MAPHNIAVGWDSELSSPLRLLSCPKLSLALRSWKVDTTSARMLQNTLEMCRELQSPVRLNFAQISQEIGVKYTTLRHHYDRSLQGNPITLNDDRLLLEAKEAVLSQQIDYLGLRRI